MTTEIDKAVGIHLLELTKGIQINLLENEYVEPPTPLDKTKSFQKLIFKVDEEEPDKATIGILFTLSLMSFTFAAPQGYSYNEFIPDEEWNIGYFVEGLRYEYNNICFEADNISDRCVKTYISYESGGAFTLTTINRGKEAERWLTYLQGKNNIQAVK